MRNKIMLLWLILLYVPQAQAKSPTKLQPVDEPYNQISLMSNNNDMKFQFSGSISSRLIEFPDKLIKGQTAYLMGSIHNEKLHQDTVAPLLVVARANPNIFVSVYLRYVMGLKEPEAYRIESDCAQARAMRRDEEAEIDFRRCLMSIEDLTFEVGFYVGRVGRKWTEASVYPFSKLEVNEEVFVAPNEALKSGARWSRALAITLIPPSSNNKWRCTKAAYYAIPRATYARLCNELTSLQMVGTIDWWASRLN